MSTARTRVPEPRRPAGQRRPDRDRPDERQHHAARAPITTSWAAATTADRNDNVTLRYYYNDGWTSTRSATAPSARSSAGTRTSRTRTSPQPHAHLQPNVSTSPGSRWCSATWFPRERPGEPDGRHQRPLQDRRRQQLPAGPGPDSWQFSNTLTWAKGRHTLKFGADIRYIELDNQAAFNSKGTFNFNNLQDYMNNNAQLRRPCRRPA